MNRLLCLLILLGLTSCLQTRRDRFAPEEPYQTPYSGPELEPGQIVTQGMVGASFLTEVERSGGTNPPEGPQPDDLERHPLIAGAFQWPLWGRRIDAGLELGGSLGFQSGGGYVSGGDGELVVAVDIDMYVFDLYGGPFVSTALGDDVRVWVSAGPLLQFAEYDLEGEADISARSSGFGTGLYARAGVDLVVSKTMMVGVGARWLDTHTSLGGTLGHLDMQGTEVFVTFTSGF